MPYISIESFAGGVDRSRPRYVGIPGSLWSGINGHISRGGDFEKRKAFTEFALCPAGKTVGLAKTSIGITVFGSVDPATITIPTGVAYQRLQHPTDPTRTVAKIVSWDLYNGKIYAVAKFDNGDVFHYYDGGQVTDWNAGGNKPTGYGNPVRTFKRKVYSPAGTASQVGGSVLYFSGVDTATGWDKVANSGAGFQNLSTHESGSDSIVALGIYQNYLAAFTRRVTQIWQMNDDATTNAPFQTMYEIGVRAPRSVKSFGDLDLFLLSDSGVRSVRTRSYANLAGVNDVGTPIDAHILDWVISLDAVSTTTVDDAVAVIEPTDSRYWLAIGSRVYVFSYFPSKKISAWTWYEPGFTFTDLVSFNGRVYGRSGDRIYLYGGSDNNTYDNCPVTVELPFLSVQKPATFKQWEGIDIASVGEWNLKALVEPDDESQYVDIGDESGVTFNSEATKLCGRAPAIAITATCNTNGPAKLSAMALHYVPGSAS